MPRKFDVDDVVYAKWPGSTRYFRATVIDFSDGKYQVKFEDDDDTTSEVYTKHMMSLGEAENAQRPKTPLRKRSRSSSPGRRRSRSSSPSRRKTASPTRQPRSPTRQSRSSGRPRKYMAQTPEKEGESPIVSSKQLNVDVQRVESEKSISVKDDEKNGNVEEIDTSVLITEKIQHSSGLTTSTVTRRTTRSVTRALQEESSTEPNSDSSTCSLSAPCTVLSKLKCCVQTIASLVGAVLAVIMPVVFVYGMYLPCKTKKSCTFLVWPVIPACEKFFNWKSTGYVFGWFLFQLGLASLPLGKKITGPQLPNGKKQELYLNGIAQFFISMALVGGLTYYGKFPYKFITVNYLSLVTASALYGLILSVAVYIISRNANEKEPSGGAIADFVKGRIISPMLCPYIDLKLYAFKTANISWVILNLCYLLRELNAGKDILKTNPSFALIQIFHIWYAVDLLVFEETVLHTATMSKEKFGAVAFMLLMFFPYYCMHQARYLVLYPINYPWHMYICPVLLHLVGYYIYRISLNQKLLFRKDINKANELGIKSIPTKDGRGLLIGGFWGVLRHPNYTGDFMMIFGWSLICGVSHILPWIWVISLLFTLIAMAKNDDEQCFKKYGSSWQEYRERVKYKFIPFVC